MILRVNRPTIFIPTKAFRDAETKDRQTLAPKGRWIIVQLKQTAFRVEYKDPLGAIGLSLQVDRDLLVGLLIEELERDTRASAILSDDALLVHPESFGRAMIKIGKTRT